MKILKGMALGFVGFFLFISLPFLGILISLNTTLLNPDFIVKEIYKLDITEIVRDYINTELPPEASAYSSAIDDTLTQEKPWINQQINLIVHHAYDYLLGNIDELKFNVDLEEVKVNVSNNIINSIQNNPPADFQKLSSQEKALYLSDLKKQIQDNVPSNYEININEELIGQDGVNALLQVKNILGILRISFWILIIMILVFIFLIILIQKEIRGSIRTLGVIFLIDGILCGISYFVLKILILLYLSAFNLPLNINSWITVFINDLFCPWGVYSLVIAVLGLAGLVVSFFIKGNPQYNAKISQPVLNS
jgi:hypothetical protein